MQKFKQELARVFDDNLRTKQWQNIADWVIIGLIILSTIEVFLSTFDPIADRYGSWLKGVDLFTTIFFTVEVTLRIWCADIIDPKYKGFWGRVRYCFSFYGLIDILSTYTFYIAFLLPIPYSLLKALRIARLMRVFRYLKAFRILSRAISNKSRELLVSLEFLAIVTLILSFILYFVEHEAQPEVYENGWTSVVWAFAQYIGDPGGFADMPPVTLAGQIIACLVGVLGIAIFAVPAGLVGSSFSDVMEEEKEEQETKDNIDRIVHSFKFNKDQQYTNLFYVPRYKPINTIVTTKFLSEETIISAVEKSDCLHLFNLAEAVNRADKPEDKVVVVNYYRNRPYGCCIDRHSKVTIVETSGYTEPISSWYAYHVAKLGGFNFVSKEVEPDPYNPVSYYTITNTNDCPNMKLFLEDIDRLSAADDSWVVLMLHATGESSRPHQLHFCYGAKGDESMENPAIRIEDKAKFEQLYSDLSDTMQSKYGLRSDRNKYYGVLKTNTAYYIKCKNVFTLRVEAKMMVFDSNVIETAKTFADVFNRHLEPGIEKPLPPEMLERPKGHDFGMSDYIN